MTAKMHVSPRAGLNGKNHPYWQGERAEAIVSARIAAYPPRKTRAARLAPDDPRRLARKKLSRLKRRLKKCPADNAARRAQLTTDIKQLEEQLA